MIQEQPLVPHSSPAWELEEETGGGGRSLSPWRKMAALAILAMAGGLLYVVVSEVGWSALGHRLAALRWWALGLAVVGLLAQLGAWAARWGLALRGMGYAPGPLFVFSTIAAAKLANLLAPFARLAGGWLRARYMARFLRQPVGRCYGVVLFDQMAHLGVMGVLTGVVLLVLAVRAGGGGAAVVLALATAATTMLGIWFWRRDGGQLRSRAKACALAWLGATPSEGRLALHGRGAVEALGHLFSNSRLRWQAVALGVAIVVLNSLAQWALFHGLGRAPSLGVVLATLALGMAAGTLAGTPGGLGATEGAMVGVYVSLGVPPVDAAAATLLFRGLSYILVLALGIPAAILLEVQLAALGREASPS